MVKTFLEQPAFVIAEDQFKKRLFAAWLVSSPTAHEDRENLYMMAKAFDGMKLELKKILNNAQADLAKNENTRRQRDMDSWGREY